MDRRDFLASSGLAAIGLGLHPGTAAATPLADTLSRDAFLRLVGTPFTAVDEKGTVRRLSLSAVRPGPEVKGLDQFSLVFEHADGRGPCTGLCWMRHDEMGWFQVRLDTGAETCCCATFSLVN